MTAGTGEKLIEPADRVETAAKKVERMVGDSDQ
jgi:hypothetical protein